jgi:hypothetical protein
LLHEEPAQRRNIPTAVQQGGYVSLSREDAQALYLESSLSYRWGIPRLVDAIITAANGEGKRLTS